MLFGYQKSAHQSNGWAFFLNECFQKTVMIILAGFYILLSLQIIHHIFNNINTAMNNVLTLSSALTIYIVIEAESALCKVQLIVK